MSDEPTHSHRCEHCQGAVVVNHFDDCPVLAEKAPAPTYSLADVSAAYKAGFLSGVVFAVKPL